MDLLHFGVLAVEENYAYMCEVYIFICICM